MLQKAAFCVQLRRLASDAKPSQGLVAAEMKKLSQVQLSALHASASGSCFQYYSVSIIASGMVENPCLQCVDLPVNLGQGQGA